MGSNVNNLPISELMKYVDVPKVIQPTSSFIESTPTELMDIDTFISTFKNDPNLAKLPFPEWVYEKYNIPKPEVLGLRSYLNKSVKTVMFSGWEAEVRKPDDKGVRKIPFLSTCQEYDLSGNLNVYVSTFTE